MIAFLTLLATALRNAKSLDRFGIWPLRGPVELQVGKMGGLIMTYTDIDEQRNDRIRRATQLSELSGVNWARCYADLLDADLNPYGEFSESSR